MIETLIASLLTFALAITGMAVGLLARRRELAKGCLGLGTLGDTPPASACRVCGRPAGGAGCGGAPAARSEGGPK